MSSEADRQRVLIFGAGRVSGPVVEHLSNNPHIDLTIVSFVKAELTRAQSICPKASLVQLDITVDSTQRDELIKTADIAVGLVPCHLTEILAEMCLKYNTNLVMASYVSDKIQKLHERAKSAGLTFLCEMGLDPGIDHMLAVRAIDQIRDRGGKVTSYELWCGGLPAPECANNPLQYKFSWYPRGALESCQREAGYLHEGQVVKIPGGGSQVLERYEDAKFQSQFKLEGYPNEFHSSYLKLYNIESVDTFIRGTLRYKGFCSVVIAMMKLGLFSEEKHSLLLETGPDITWKSFIANAVGLGKDVTNEELDQAVVKQIGGDDSTLSAIKSMGFLDDIPIAKTGTPLDCLAGYLEKKLAYGPGERDLVVMHIEVSAEYPDSTRERTDIDLVVFGEAGGHSAMAKTVGYTIGTAVQLILEGKITEKGVVIPVTRGIYNLVLPALEEKGISVKQNTVKL
ncbi:alpha-aminoadipic semialdehyde synthase, mitochondrial-like [Gigantopelta aegis]|uniref:alpha-aminoadipic semialdehyde synthase, mitochondrial-like n=1 Tax=Gigantopelta aegis TaxID=1735272 RepID=UPI001B887D8A|nr:alpha-aminoadipic semialdehyde synthase, mitochondrial-like [Gigantopelta aegis]